MLKAHFSVYDFTVNSLRKTLDNVRIMVLATLTFMGGLILAGLGSMVIVSPTIIKLWPLMVSFKQSMPAVGTMLDKAAQAKLVADAWQHITPFFTMIDFALMVLSVTFFLVVVLGLVLGFLRVALDLVDRGESAVARMYGSFSVAPRFFLAALLSMIIIALGFVVFIIPGIILTLRLRFFPYYILDKNLGAIASLKASFHATKGYEWEILGLNIVAAVLAGFVPVIGIPVTCFLLAYAYRALPTV